MTARLLAKADAAPLILASGSATRQRMLEHAGVPYKAVPSAVDEAPLKASLIEGGAPARDIADALADLKARHGSMMQPTRLVLGADQVLVQDGRFFTKATNRDEAAETLKALSGKSHQLVSAAVIYDGGQPVWRAVTTATLSVRDLSDDFIKQYLDTLGDDAYWSVGSYQLEGLGAQLFDRIDGDMFTILGMPLIEILDFLRRYGILIV